MKNTAFIIHRDNLIRKYLTESNIDNNESLYGQYTMVSSNLANYLPEIDAKKHMQLFIQLLIHKKLSKLEQAAEEALSYLTTENLTEDTLQYLREKPAIICTFHTGSYRMINMFLVKMKIPFTLVIGKSILEREGQAYYSLFTSLKGDFRNDGFKIIDAENAQSGLQMIRELKKGRVLLLFLDGNSGAGTATVKNENACIINFLYQQLYARTGIGYLGHAAQVPIFPVINYRPSWNEIRLKFYEAILPDNNEDRGQFAKRAIQMLYDHVATIIRKYPEQWEAWLYLHKVAKISNQLAPKSGKKTGEFLSFNFESFGLFKINSKPFLFQKGNYTSYPIDICLFSSLWKSMSEPVACQKFKPHELNELHKRGVLHYL